MTNVFENPWLLATLAALSLVPAAILRQAKPEWGYRPLLIPLLLACLGVGLDYAVQTDNEQIHAIIRTCRNAAVEGNAWAMGDCISPDYDDGYHRGKTEFLTVAEQRLRGASLKKINFQEIRLTLEETSAVAEMDTVVHLNADSQYAAFGSVLFVSLRLDFVKQSPDRWFILKTSVTSVNNQPINWGAIR